MNQPAIQNPTKLVGFLAYAVLCVGFIVLNTMWTLQPTVMVWGINAAVASMIGIMWWLMYMTLTVRNDSRAHSPTVRY